MNPVPMVSRTITAWLVLAALSLPVCANAQHRLVVRGEVANVRNDYIGTLAGGAVLAVFPLSNSGASVHVGVERLWGGSMPIANPCGGFILPGQFSCSPEVLDLNADAAGLLAGVRVRVGPERRAELHLGANVGFTRLSSTGMAVVSRTPFDLQQTMFRGDLMMEAEITPWQNRRLGVVVGQSIGVYTPAFADEVLDGFTPLNATANVWRGWLGVSWQFAARP